MPVLRHFKRHLFLYFFIAVQVVFLVWAVSAGHAPSIPAHCYDAHGNVDIFKGNDCASTAGSETGAAISVGLIFGIWVAFDLVFLLGRVVVLLSRRGKKNKED